MNGTRERTTETNSERCMSVRNENRIQLDARLLGDESAIGARGPAVEKERKCVAGSSVVECRRWRVSLTRWTEGKSDPSHESDGACVAGLGCEADKNGGAPGNKNKLKTQE